MSNTGNRAVVRRCVMNAVLALSLLAIALSAPASARTYSLEECIDIALANSIPLQEARENLEGAQADVQSAWSNVLPHLSAGASRRDSWRVSEGEGSSSKNYSGDISLSQSIFRGGANFASISRANHSRSAYRHSLESAERDLIFAVKQAYYSLLKAGHLREVQEEALGLAQEQLRRTQSLFDLGSASKSDLLKAQVQVGEAQLALISVQKQEKTARVDLSRTLGIDALTQIEAIEPTMSEEEILDFDLAEALARRPDLRAWEESVTAARSSLTSSKAGRWPDLSFSLSFSRDNESASGLFEDMTDDYARTTSLSLSVPIFDGLSTKSSISRSEATLRKYELSLRDARLSAAYEIETARLEVAEQTARVAVAERSVEAALEDLNISEERYRLRALSMIDLIISRAAYSRAREELVGAQYDNEIAKARLRKALGL